MGRRRKRAAAKESSLFDEFVDTLQLIARKWPIAGGASTVAALIGGAGVYAGHGLNLIFGILLYLLAALLGMTTLVAWVRQGAAARPAARSPAPPVASSPAPV